MLKVDCDLSYIFSRDVRGTYFLDFDEIPGHLIRRQRFLQVFSHQFQLIQFLHEFGLRGNELVNKNLKSPF